MTEDQLQEISNTVQKVMEKNFNGKLTTLTQEFRDHKTIVNQYIVDDNKWKEKAQPVILMGENVAGFGKVSLYIVGFVASVGGAIVLLINLLKDPK